MRIGAAKEIGNIIGWLVLGGAISLLPGLMVGATLQSMGGGAAILLLTWVLFALGTGAAIALIQKSSFGFYLLYVVALASVVGPRINFLPFSNRILPAGPESEYYSMAFNLVIVALAAWSHWSISKEDQPSAGKRTRTVIASVLVSLGVGAIYWKTGIRTGNGEVPRMAELPVLGKDLAPLQSTQPLLYRFIELRRKDSATIVFRGVTSTNNLQAFVDAHDLKLMTNVAARVRFLPIVKNWKLDPVRFPVFNGETDLCYIGRLPKGSKRVFQICLRPSEGMFTAMAMGSAAASSHAPEK